MLPLRAGRGRPEQAGPRPTSQSKASLKRSESPRTARRAAGSAGEPLEGELARFFGYSNDVLAILDDRGVARVLSPSIERVLGYRVGEVVGRSVLRLVHPADRALMRSRVSELAMDQPVSDLDVRVMRADGTGVPMRWSLALGPHRRIYAVGRDRTVEARRAEAVLGNEVAELRLRTAMELHDGILQTLTGASLQIAVARRLLRRDPAAAEEVLAALADTVSAEQQEMRLYVDEVKGQSPPSKDGAQGLPERIAMMLDRVRAIWGTTAALEVDLNEAVSAEVGRRVLRIIQEATVNAARHGAAKAVSIRVALEGPEVAIHITDDGHGFPFLGEYDTDALRKERLGPLSLKHRVEDGEGRIFVRSTRQGSTVSVWLPVSTEVKP
jgi:PAS domain S-box-containing protein